MRKALSLLLALLLLFSVGFTALHVWVNGRKENVTWVEETIYGDKSHVSGAVVSTRNHQDQNLLWETEGILGDKLNPTTNFTFSNESIQSDNEITYDGLYMNSNEDFLASLAFNGGDRIPEYAKEKYADLIAYCRACYDSVEMGEEKFFTVDLNEYMDYYSLSGTFDFPDSHWGNFDEFDYFVNSAIQVNEEIIQAMNDFFRIPILGEYKAEFSINLYHAGGSTGVSYGGGVVEDEYRPYFDAIYVKDTCYLTFNAAAENGEVADTSLIPGGYGIYRLNIRPDGEGGLIADDPIATMVYSMDPSEEFFYLEASDDSRHIYLHTWQGTKLMRTIIDIETMETLQKIELLDQPELFYRDMKQYDDFLVILQLSHNNQDSDANTITVFEEDERGLYHHSFTVPMNTQALNVHEDLVIFNSITESMDFDGETLLVVQNEFESDRYAYSYGDSCNFYVLAYNADGLAYAGKYHVNLAQNSEQNGDWPVKPFYQDPIVIAWQ